MSPPTMHCLNPRTSYELPSRTLQTCQPNTRTETSRKAKDILNIVLELPPAPAALVELGLALATLSARSAAAFLLIAVAGPPGGLGDEGRAPVDAPEAVAPALTGEEGRGEDCSRSRQRVSGRGNRETIAS